MPKPKLCTDCGTRHKRKRHPLWCDECWLRRQPVDVRHYYAARRLAAVPPAFRRNEVTGAPAGRQWCRGCQTFVLYEDAKSGAPRCNTCTSVVNHARMAERVYGADYERMFKRQGGRCAGCGGRPQRRRLAIDHDHKTGKVRGLLCSTCNHELLGVAERLADPVGTLRRLADYLANGGVVGDNVGFRPPPSMLDLLCAGEPVDPAAYADAPF
jgi:hypothetical protein